MSRLAVLIVMAAALGLGACVPTTIYGKLYPKPVSYRYGKPQPNFGTGPLPVPGPSQIPKRSPARLPTPFAR